MHVEIRYFGHFSNITGKKGETIEIAEDSTLNDILQRLSVKYEVEFRENLFDPETREVRPSNWILVNGKDMRELLGLKTKISSGDQINLLPAIGGG